MRYALFLLALSFLSMTACSPNFDDDASNNSFEGWEDTNITTTNPILNAHAGDDLLLISTKEFFRIGPDENTIEKRPVNDLIYGRPVLSDHVYAYIKKDGNFKDIVSFHLVNNADAVKEISSTELVSENNKTIVFETNTRTPGVFNDDGTQFVIPALVFPDFNYHFFVFDIELNAAKTAFTSVTLAKEVVATQMPAEFGSLTNLRFIDGLFYAASYSGGFRFHSGMDEAQRLFPHWTIDFFKKDGMYYSTGLFFHDFFVSESGESWIRNFHESSLNNVEMVEGELFSQNSLGWPYKYVEDLREGSEIAYPTSFPDNNTFYNNIVKFNGKYYMTVDTELHTFGDEIPVK